VRYLYNKQRENKTMTKKHFEIIAKGISNIAREISNSSASNEEKHYGLIVLRNTMHELSVEFHKDNANFNEINFFESCKVEGYLGFIETKLANKEEN
jgi:hypothetical protein|tara:strand:+ start:66 stop:356 length:291 start_codon:yes stop_codon:yes gene_type:complete